MKRSQKNHRAHSSDDDDEEELLKAAGLWANQQDVVARDEPKKLSLHITQLSYDATDFDIRQAFSNAGCLIDSVRLVYDWNSGKRVFRGVAFIDLSNEASYHKALELHHTNLLGRRINVRPTRTKTELADIVKNTQQLVAAKMAQQGITSQSDFNERDTKDRTKSSKKKRKRNSDNESELKKEASLKSTSENSHDKAANKDATKEKSKTVEKDHTMSKKQRNRRAAILMSKRRSKV